MTKPSPKPQEEPDGPALVKPSHCFGRNLSKVAGSKAGWENLSPFERAHRLGHLVCKERCTNDDATKLEIERALDRYYAGDELADGWKLCNATWPSGSDLNRIGGQGCPGAFVDAHKEAKDYWRRVEINMGTRDWMICRRVCGEGYTIAETVTDISPSYRHSTLARFREALDALIDGMSAAKKHVSRGTK